MNIFRLAFEIFLLYLAYKLVFEFIIPIYKTTKQMKQKMSDMHQKMTSAQQQQPSHKQTSKATIIIDKKTGNEDYIDYEEIK